MTKLNTKVMLLKEKCGKIINLNVGEATPMN